MPFKTEEAVKQYRQRPETRAKRNARAKARYAKDPSYRKQRIEQAAAHRKTQLGTIMSRIRRMNFEARKLQYHEITSSARLVLSCFNGYCDLCRTPRTIQNAVIDHDHITGAFRGWLCSNCNSGLGYFKDSIELLSNAAVYLHASAPLMRLDTATKDSNPKDIIGSTKVPLSLVPGTTKVYLALGHLEGHSKYGLVNWREAGVRLSVYLDALERHIEKLKGGEWSDPATQLPHLANAITCLSIIIDAHECGKLIDDRPKGAPVAKVIDEASKNVQYVKGLFADKKPVDYFITGAKQREG